MESPLGDKNEVLWNPEGSHISVISRGNCWKVDPAAQTAELLDLSCTRLWHLENGDLLIEDYWVAFARIGPDGFVWSTPDLALDGLDDIRIESNTIKGKASSTDVDVWIPFSIDLDSGRIH